MTRARPADHADERWTLAQDRKLRRLFGKLVREGEGKQYERWQRVGRALGRTAEACSMRWAILRVADRYVKIDRKKRS